MAKGLSFSAVLKLQKQQFDAGMREVKRSLNDLKSTFTQIAGALGAGLGLAAFVGNMKETAVQLSVVKATLENVSKSTEEYGESLEFLRRIAKDYGQDQNVLTMGFAKFSAAARGCGIELEEVKSIYESLTRAAGAYHLSAEATQSVMLAVEQMFSKGKVTAEELRRQLGNSLPNAFNMMAAAAGKAGITVNGTAAELDKMMRNGQVLAAEVMPYFARELDKATTGANFDSLQSSLNRLQNSWYNFVETTNMEGAFNGLVKAGSTALNLINGLFKVTGIQIRDIAIALAGGLGFKYFGKEADAVLEKTAKQFWDIVEATMPLQDRLAVLEATMDQLRKKDPGELIAISLESARAKAAGLNEELVRTIALNEQAGKTGELYALKSGDAMKYTQNEIDEINNLLDVEAEKAGNAAMKVFKGQDMLKKQTIGIGSALKGLVPILKSVGTMFIATFAISLLTRFAESIVNIGKELKRLNDIPKNIVKDAEKMSDATEQQLAHLQEQVNILKYYKDDEEKRKKAIEEINNVLGKQEGELFTIDDSLEKINAEVEEWGHNLIESAKGLQKWEALEAVDKKISELNAKLLEIRDTEGYGEVELAFDGIDSYVEKLTHHAEQLYNQELKISAELKKQLLAREKLVAAGALAGKPQSGDVNSENFKAVTGAISNYKNAAAELEAQKKNGALTEKEYQKELQKTQAKVYRQIAVYDDLDEITKKLSVDQKKLFNDIKNGFNAGSGGGGGGGGKKTPIEQLRDTLDGYIEDMLKVQNQLRNGVITQEEYDNSIIKLAENTRKAAGAFEDLEGALSEAGNRYQSFFQIINGYGAASEASLSMSKVLEESLENANEELEEALDESLDKLIDYQNKAGEILSRGTPEFKQRDTFFDYKKSDKDILGENAGNLDDWIASLKEVRDELTALGKSVEGGLDPVMQGFLDRINEKLREATKNAKDLHDKAKMAELAEDMEKFTKAVREAKFDSIKEVASSFDRLVKSIESVSDALEDMDKANRTPLDDLKLLASMISEIIQLITTFKSVTEGFNEVQEAMANKRKAENAQMLVQTGAVIAAQEAQVASETKSAAATVAAESTKQAAMAKTTTAEAGSAIAGAASSVASVPYVGPVLAAAAVASMVALFAANLKKFQSGGIVGGNSYSGDNQLIRANSKEMVLTTAQQAGLWNFIKNGSVGGGGQVKFVLRGTDLIGSIENTRSRMNG